MTTPTLPSYCTILLNGYQEQRESALLRSEMESGPPKQAKVRYKVMNTRSVNILVDGLANYNLFKTWFSSDLSEGASWFTFTDPVTSSTVTARFVGGGFTATPLTGGLTAWQINAKIESWG